MQARGAKGARGGGRTPASVCGHFLGLNTHVLSLAKVAMDSFLFLFCFVLFCFLATGKKAFVMPEISMFSPGNQRENCPGW